MTNKLTFNEHGVCIDISEVGAFDIPTDAVSEHPIRFTLVDGVVVQRYKDIADDQAMVDHHTALQAKAREAELAEANKPDTQLSKLGFLRRFTAQERVDIRGSTDAFVKDAMELIDLAEYIDLADSETVALVNMLESKALIGTGRAAEVLAP